MFNRTEIARRVLWTATAFDCWTVVVYVDADRGTDHVRRANEAIRRSAVTASERYLLVDLIIKVPKLSRVKMVCSVFGF